MADLHITKVNNTYITVACDFGIKQELRDYFAFYAPNHQWSPMFKQKVWDGKIYLYNMLSSQIYTGLLYAVLQFADSRKYTVSYDNELDFSTNEFSLAEAYKFISTLGLPEEITPYDHQIQALLYTVRHNRQIFISPTASGKSLMTYLIMRFYSKKKILIIVPTINLVEQLYSDFVNDYGYQDGDKIALVYDGFTPAKVKGKNIIISTWQSIYKLNKNFFSQFDVIIGDEAHTYETKSIKAIMEKCTNADVRIGLTGTLKDIESSRLTLEGLFGPARVIATTNELIEKNIISKFRIKVIVLQYSDEDRKLVSKMDYTQEKEFLAKHPKRNRFLKNLLLSLKGNTIFLTDNIKDHAKPFYAYVKKESEKGGDKDVRLVIGEIAVSQRELLRKYMETQDNIAVISNYQILSTGVNIKRLRNLVFGSSTKSKVRVLQSMGRSLRKTKHYDISEIFDIADDLKFGKKENTTYSHLAERIKVYANEDFDYKIYKVKL